MKPPEFLRKHRYAFYAVALVLLGFLLAWNLRSLYGNYRLQITGQFARRQILSCRMLARDIGDGFVEIAGDLRLAASRLAAQGSGEPDLGAAIFPLFGGPAGRGGAATVPGLLSVAWIGADGSERDRIGLDDGPLSPTGIVGLAAGRWTEPSVDGFRVVGPVRSPAGRATLWVTVPVPHGQEGGPPDRLAAEIDIRRYVDGTVPGLQTWAETDLLIVDPSGTLVYSTHHPEYTLMSLHDPPDACSNCHESTAYFARTSGAAEGWCEWTSPLHPELAAYSSIEFGPCRWTLSLDYPKDSLSAALRDFRWHFVGILVTLMALVGLMAGIVVDLRRRRGQVEEEARLLRQRAELKRERDEMDRSYTELVERANDAIYILQDDRFVLVNRAFETLHGYDREELLSPDFDLMRLIAPGSRDLIRERGERRQRGEPLDPTYEFQVLHRDDTEIDVEINVNYIQYHGRPAVQGILRDIRGRKRREERKELMLRLSNIIRDSRDLEALAGNALDCVTKILGMDIGALYIYDEATNRLELAAHKGLRGDTLEAQKRYRVEPGERGVAPRTALRREILIVDDVAESPVLTYLPERERLRGKGLVSMPLEARDQLLGVLQLVRDGSRESWSYDVQDLEQVSSVIAGGLHRRKIAIELADKQRRLKHLFDNTREVVYRLDPDGNLMEINRPGIDLFGHDTGDGAPEIRMARLWKSVRARDACLETLRTRGRVRDVEVECLCNDGTLRTFLESTVGMHDEEGRLIEYQGIMRDITSIKQAREALHRKNRELERANAELRDLDRMKDRFISTISHELRTPLTSIKGSLDILIKGMVGELEEKTQGIVAICHRNAERLIALVEDLIQIQQLESSQAPLEIDEVRLDEVIPGVLDRIGKACAKKGIRLVSRIDPGAGAATILADGRRIQSALHNLLSNAVKFSERGTITLEATVSDGEIHLSVSDNGPGIPEQMRENIFEKFTQVDGSNTREKGGTGLGLAITRSIVEKHGGRIWVESEQGHGSRFTFSLPRRTGEEGAEVGRT